MRDPQLERLLRAFAEEAALQLAADTASGAEVPFEIVEAGAGGPGGVPLYCYRPLTAEFIRGRVGVLGRLPSYAPAARALEERAGTDRYLAARGEPRVFDRPRDRADAVLRVLLAEVFAETSEFVVVPERFARAYADLEGALLRGRSRSEVLAPVVGLRLEGSAEIAIGEGLSLVRGHAVEEAPAGAVRPNGPVTFARLVLETPTGEPLPTAAARARLRTLQTALRLLDRGGVALGATAWGRTDGGPWEVLDGPGGGRTHGAPVRVLPDAEDELRAFVNLVARRAPGPGEVAWALDRFEMAAGRGSPFEALTDVLLALRALLEPEGPGCARLADRLAAICAHEPDRPALAALVERAEGLERAVITGAGPDRPGADALVAELTDHLRALLRDVLCGHLEPDLAGLADRLLGEVTAEAAW